MLTNDDLKGILATRLEEVKDIEPKRDMSEDMIKTILKTLSLPADMSGDVKTLLDRSEKLNVLWLHFFECTGCSESLLRTATPNFDDFIFDFISLKYHETVMNASGWQAEEILEDSFKKDYVIAVEGGVGIDLNNSFVTVGPHAQKNRSLLEEAAKDAKAIFAIGSCSVHGGIQAADPNVIRACSINEVLSEQVVNIPGCPPSDINIVANLLFYAIFRTIPNLDERGRPAWAYEKCLHDMCERKAKFESGEFADKFDDEKAKNGACLYKIGCKGPYTFNNCPKVKFNSKTSWPVAAGHGCIACSEPDFWDNYGVYELPMNNEFSYRDNKIKNPFNKKIQNLNVKRDELDIKDNMIVINFDGETGILYKKDGEVHNYLNLEFESNLKLFMQTLSKNKLGAKLIENFSNSFNNHADFINQNFDDNSDMSKDILKFLELNHIVISGKEPNLKEFLDLASEYKYPHYGPYYFKLTPNGDKLKFDISKSLRMPIIYFTGGLEARGVAFNAVMVVIKSLVDATKQLNKDNEKLLYLNIDENLNSEFLQTAFAQFI